VASLVTSLVLLATSSEGGTTVHPELPARGSELSIAAELIKARNEHKAHLPDKEEGLLAGQKKKP